MTMMSASRSLWKVTIQGPYVIEIAAREAASRKAMIKSGTLSAPSRPPIRLCDWTVGGERKTIATKRPFDIQDRSNSNGNPVLTFQLEDRGAP
jgi:hypothetical protein